ncbi:MAG: hypothetical protein JWP37_689 [Mucilaginibacter sp.]|nr:hypothetical protein [Mucilaginibacter sp.]
MKNILIFNDFSSEAEHATEMALLLAGKTNTNLYVWNMFDKAEQPMVKELVVANANEIVKELSDDNTAWIEKLESKLNWQRGLMPVVHFINDVDYAPNDVLPIVKKYDIGVLIKGITESGNNPLHIESEALSCSTKSGCPILLIPEKVKYKAFEKMVYATDLRFCRHEVVTFLTQLAKHLNANVMIANISAQGLPYMEDTYARSVFEHEILNPMKYENVYFSNIRERDIPKALDVLVNGMNNDLLVLVNNKYHFKELLGHSSPHNIPDNIHIPLLIFPS